MRGIQLIAMTSLNQQKHSLTNTHTTDTRRDEKRTLTHTQVVVVVVVVGVDEREISDFDAAR